MTVEQTTVDPAKVQATMGKVVEELGVALGTLTATLGWRAGLWQAMAGAGPLTPAELAGQVGTAEAYAREWLKAQAAGGWVAYDPAGGRFTLPDEVAAAIVHGPGGAILDACVTMLLAMGQDFPAYVEAFRGGQGVGWDQKSPAYLDGADALGRVALGPEQVGAFLDGLDGAGPRLDSGGRVADIGYGSPTIALATARAHARVDGFDAHDGSIAHSWEEANLARAPAVAEEAVALARELDDPATLSFSLLALHDARWRPGSAGERLPVVEEMLALAATAGDRELLAQARLLRAVALVELGDRSGLADLEEYCRLAGELGHPGGRWGALSRRAAAAGLAGRLEEARALAEEARQLGRRIGQPDATASPTPSCGSWGASTAGGRLRGPTPGRPRATGRRGGPSCSPRPATWRPPGRRSPGSTPTATCCGPG